MDFGAELEPCPDPDEFMGRHLYGGMIFALAGVQSAAPREYESRPALELVEQLRAGVGLRSVIVPEVGSGTCQSGVRAVPEWCQSGVRHVPDTCQRRRA